MSAKNFIKTIDSALYDELQLELYGSDRKPVPVCEEVQTKLGPPKKNIFKGILPLSVLDSDHEAVRFVESRKIPNDDFYFVEKFMTWASTINPEYKIPERDSSRLLIPMRNKSGDIVAFQGRLLSKGSGPKYISVKIDEDVPLVWGLDRVRGDRHIIVVEGPIDAMFLPNAIACCGSDITTDLKNLGFAKDQFQIVYDNEPRSKFTIRKMKKALDRDFSVCIWPDDVKEKDVNEMVLARLNQGLDEACYDVWMKIKNNIFNGLSAEIRLSEWAKVKSGR